jgi:hypothetical protein
MEYKTHNYYGMVLPKEACKLDYNTNDDRYLRYYLFNYNCDFEVNDIINYSTKDISMQFFLHPVIYDINIVNIARNWPVGI